MNDVFHQAVALHQKGQIEQAESLYLRVLSFYPQHSDALDLLGVLYCQTERLTQGVSLLQKAIKTDPKHAEARVHLAIALQDSGNIEGAYDAYLAALELAPDHPSVLINISVLLQRQNRLQDALSFSRRAVSHHPNHPKAWDVLGCILQDINTPLEAEAAHRRALALTTTEAAGPWTNLGNALRAQNRLEESELAHRQALVLQPDFADAYVNLGVVLQERNDRIGAVVCFRRALDLGFDDGGATQGHLIHNRLQMADWRDLDIEINNLLQIIRERPDCAVDPFITLLISDSPSDHFIAAQRYAEWIKIKVANIQSLPLQKRHNHKPLKIGYLSADFHLHPTSILMVSVLEKHDRKKFEVYGYSLGLDDGSPLRKRVETACDHFVDVSTLSTPMVAKRIRADGIDILIDLKGYTRNAQPEILALRPAPLQINYLGYPGTMGADFIDGVIVDAVVAPQTLQPWFTEKLLSLPNCYQANDSLRKISNAPISRAMFGLSEENFVFCCFNAISKITPMVFQIWLKLLHKLPNSVLWLLAGDKNAPDNLRQTAIASNIDPNRLLFAPRQPAEQFRACLRLADLFLDTFPYNAHTTASDALWAGLPVLTCPGSSFPSRVGASLLHAIELTELIVPTWDDYIKTALRLATSPQDLARIKHHLNEIRESASLFNDKVFVQDLENLLQNEYFYNLPIDQP
ncbi:protein O-GlcNAc transferase [Azospirillaceae bacterium]